MSNTAIDPNAGVAPAPPGVVANTSYSGPDDKGLALAISCIVIGTLFVTVRVIARLKALRRLTVDDWFLVAGWGSAIAYFGTNLYANSLGFGRHLWNIPVSKVVSVSEWVAIIGLIYIVPVLCLKTSFFFSYLHVFGSRRSMKLLCWIGMICCLAFYIAIFFGTIFNCSPALKTFDTSVEGTCRAVMPLALASGIFNCISDFYITVIPIPYIWTLQMEFKKKLRVGIVFGMGVFCTAVSFARLGLTVRYAGAPDAFYSYWIIAICAHLEVLFGIMAASCLAMPLFMEKILRPTASSLAVYLKVRSSTTLTDSRTGHQDSMSQTSKEEHLGRGGSASDEEAKMIINRVVAYSVERV